MAIAIKEEFIDELIKGCKTADDAVGSNGVVKELTKRLFERMLNAELTTHPSYEKNQISKEKDNNSRNGHSIKTVLTNDEEIEVKIPRNRKCDFEAQLVGTIGSKSP